MIDINDIFSSYNDKRNNIHLLLYFSSYGGDNKYDIDGENQKLMINAKEKGIHIIFIINKCEKEEFDSRNKDDIIQNAKDARIEELKDCKTILLNCQQKLGFKELLAYIYEKFEPQKISNLEYFKNNMVSQNDLKEKFKNNFF